MQDRYWVYILASRPHGALYVGVTNDVARRLRQHRDGHGSLHVRRYRIRLLVHFEGYANVWDAIRREKEIKKWRRLWKVELIEKANPGWRDLSDQAAFL